MTPTEQIFDAWRQNAAILQALAEHLTPQQLGLKLHEAEMDIAEHLCHVHGTRRWWIWSVDEARLEGTERLHLPNGDDWVAIRDLEIIRTRLPESAAQVEALTQDWLAGAELRRGPYETPLRFLMHQVWHEGWHVGAISAILRVHGQELNEDWEDHNLWGRWRDPGA